MEKATAVRKLLERFTAFDSWLTGFFWGGDLQEQDLKQIFEPFGALDFVTMQKDATGRSLGQAYVQCAPCTSLRSPCPPLCHCAVFNEG